MGVFNQLGDPVCPDCLCQHHEEVYGTWTPAPWGDSVNVYNQALGVGATIASVPITITETCCVVVTAAMITRWTYSLNDFEIERPKGTIQTNQQNGIVTSGLQLTHYAAREVLPAGVYTYYLVNRGAGGRDMMAAWITAVASDCLG